MQPDQPPLRAHAAPGTVPPLFLDLDELPDEFTRLPTRAEFRFDPGMPAAITVEFVAEDGPSLVRHIGRGLLHGGLTAMSGSGDIRMWPMRPGERPSSWLLLESTDAGALFEIPREPLARWLDATYRIVPAASEMDGLDWDGFLLGLLDDPGTASH
ncbi:SsgA family sporulation/cell division regulator [Streptomyces sp. V4-01]|uniref:SsgA family sporulation/cell division regulator n=1 Tax=Actinacidiphila polyblastidii TaxID=3110430 RepID=A0ABU7PM73_9ACTN|nr:SsgA family sporulation/cell division regulator [Streptomyces sp. V4-01]